MNKISSSTKLYALLGFPAKHSFSPLIHNHFFSKNNIDAVYLSFEVLAHDFKTALTGAYKMGFSGINLTMPFKEESIKYIDELDEDAKTAGSVNTIKFEGNNGIIKGYNTDISGFIKSLEDHRFKWNNAHCLVLGAGGSAKSTVYSLVKQNVKKIFIYNRNPVKAYRIAEDFNKFSGGYVNPVSSLSEVPLDKINLITNCTPAGMKQEDFNGDTVMPVPEDWNLNNKFIFDLVYNPVVTGFIKKGIKDGAKIIYGTEMLLNQAASSFEIWTGILPSISYLKKYFNKITLK